MTDLAARRSLLKRGATGTGPDTLPALDAAFDGADEAERAALARTVPASRLLRAEGWTPRAALVLAALGAPRAVAEAMASWEVRQFPDARSQALADVLAGALAGRDADWGARFLDQLAQAGGEPRMAVATARAVKAAHDLRPESADYLEWWLYAEVPAPDALPGHLRAHPEQWHEFWALFRVEPLGGDWRLVDERQAPDWAAAVAELAADPAVRARLLDESLAALLRDFAPRAVTWYPRVHRGLEPTPAETMARWGTHVAVLAAAPSVAVGLAQDTLRAALAGGARPSTEQVAALLDAPVFERTEKKLLAGQVALLADVVAAAPEASGPVGEVVASVVGRLPADVARRASALLPAAVAAPEPPRASTPPVDVPGPRRADLPPLPWDPPPLEGEALRDAVASFLEGVGDGTLLPGMMAALDGLDAAPASLAVAPAWRSLADRALAVAEGDLDASRSSPRRHLAVRLRAWLGLPVPHLDFRGFRRHVFLADDAPVPPDAEVSERTATTHRLGADGTEEVVEIHTFRAGYRMIATHGPGALLVEALRPGVVEQVALAPLPATALDWVRGRHAVGEGTFGSGDPTPPRLLYTAPGSGAGPRASYADRALDTTRVPQEYGHRVEEAREQDGHAQLAQWAGVLYANNPDVLAAHFSPALSAAVAVVNVRGVPEVFAVLGASRRLVGGPTAFALALGLSAKEAGHRAAAAEALAALAEANLLAPDVLADELAALLADHAIYAGRVAAALTDAASIGALAGHRVLQVIAALLPATAEVRGAGMLYEAGAELARAYGSPVPTPAELARRARGTSAAALALRALAAEPPRGTPLAAEAARLAAASLETPPPSLQR